MTPIYFQRMSSHFYSALTRYINTVLKLQHTDGNEVIQPKRSYSSTGEILLSNWLPFGTFKIRISSSLALGKGEFEPLVRSAGESTITSLSVLIWITLKFCERLNRLLVGTLHCIYVARKAFSKGAGFQNWFLTLLEPCWKDLVCVSSDFSRASNQVKTVWMLSDKGWLHYCLLSLTAEYTLAKGINNTNQVLDLGVDTAKMRVKRQNKVPKTLHLTRMPQTLANRGKIFESFSPILWYI